MRPTIHGENIATQIPGSDAYGRSGPLNAADVCHIIDMIHTNFCDQDDGKMTTLLSKMIDQVIDAYPDEEINYN